MTTRSSNGARRAESLRALRAAVATCLMLTTASVSAQIQFQDVTDAATDKITSESWGISAGDYNGDGWPDIFVNNHRNRPTLYRNNGNGTFTDVILQADFDTQFTYTRSIDHHLAAFADVDNDGDDDILSRRLTRGVPPGSPNDWHRRPFYSDGGYLKLSGNRSSSGDEWTAELDCNSGHPDWVWPQYGDLDDDGTLDYSCVYLGRYDFIDPAFFSHQDLSIEDFDGDGRAEVFAIRGGSFIDDAKKVSATRMEAFIQYHRTNGYARATFDAPPPVQFTIYHKGVNETLTLNGNEPEMANGGYYTLNHRQHSLRTRHR